MVVVAVVVVVEGGGGGQGLCGLIEHRPTP